MVRAKMVVTGITAGNEVKLTCQYDPEAEEDKSFCQATPWGEISMGIDNPAALEQFEVGMEFYVDFIPVGG